MADESAKPLLVLTINLQLSGFRTGDCYSYNLFSVESNGYRIYAFGLECFQIFLYEKQRE